jgi:hypothetical protein
MWRQRLWVAVLLVVTGCTPQPTTPRERGRAAGGSPQEAAPRAEPRRQDAAQAPAARPPAATAEWVVDLERDEQRGGHTIARHVGRTDAQLAARLKRESISAASTYLDLETAERVVAAALAANDRDVRRWIDRRGPRSNLAVRYRPRDGLPTGRLLRRGQRAPVEVFGAVVVLRWRGDDYYVLTSYPEEAR